MKRTALFLFALLVSITSILADDAIDKALIPTGLTLVASDSKGQILDCVAVENDTKSRIIVFSVPKNASEIRVFALGNRIGKEIPSGRYFTGLADDKKYFGLGFVKVYVEKGLFVSVDSNGFGSLSITDAMKTAIKKDLAEAKPAPITKIELAEE